MEKERRKLDKQLDVVQEKTKRAYLSQEILEAKMKVGTYKTKLFFEKKGKYGYPENTVKIEYYLIKCI